MPKCPRLLSIFALNRIDAVTRSRALAFVAGLLLAACGPSKSTTALLQARNAIKAAEFAESSKKRPYELTLAKEYYVKAKEEAGYSKFELSERLAKQAIDYAKIASGETKPTATPVPADK